VDFVDYRVRTVRPEFVGGSFGCQASRSGRPRNLFGATAGALLGLESYEKGRKY